MKRKMVYIGLPVLLGMIFASFLNNSSDYIAVPFIVLAAAFLKYPAKMKNIEVIVCIVSFAAGFSAYRFDEQLVYNKIISYSGQKVIFTGKITGISDYSGDKASYTLKGRINGVQSASMLYYGDASDCQYGDEIKLICVPEIFENTYLFNSADYYKSCGIFLDAGDVESAEIIYHDGFRLIRGLWNYRTRIYNVIMSYSPYQEGNLTAAMLFGSKIADIDDNMSTALYRLGIGHVFAVSGFHLMVMASMINAVLKKIHSGKLTAFILISASSLIFVICSGFSMSAIRAAVMIVIAYSAAVFCRTGDALNSLCIAAALMALFNPFIVRNPSFLLSVSGFFGIGVFAPYMTDKMPSKSRLQKIFKNFVSMLCMSVAVIPVSSLFFNETSAVSAFVNIILMPVASFILVLGMIVFISGGVSFIACPLLKVTSVLCRFIADIAEYAAGFKFVRISFSSAFFRIMLIAGAIFICISFAVFKNRSSVALSIIISLAVISGTAVYYRKTSENIMKISVFGNNSADAVAVEYNGTADVIDISGNRKNSRYIQTCLQKNNINTVNNIIMLEKPYRGFANYNDRLKWYDVNAFYLPENTYVLENSFICGCVPQFYSGGISLRYQDYSVNAGSDVFIVYGNYLIECSDTITVYYDNSEIMQCGISDYICFKTDGMSEAEFVR